MIAFHTFYKRASGLLMILPLLLLTGLTPNTSVASEQKQNVAYHPKVSVQLWSVKDALKEDFEGTIKAIADMGFDGVEFAGDFGPFEGKPKELKAWLKKQGLEVSGAHVAADALEGDKLDETASFYRDLGTPFLIIPMDNRAFDKDKVAEFADWLTTLSGKMMRYDMQIGYHNHAQEWEAFKDSTFYEYIAQNTPFDVVLQQDVGWTMSAGKDPKAFLKAYPCRTLTTHFKVAEGLPEGKTPILGRDGANWSDLYKDAVEIGGAWWIVIEQEQYPDSMTPMEAVRASKDGFDALVKK